jgi:hypothetical protein
MILNDSFLDILLQLSPTAALKQSGMLLINSEATRNRNGRVEPEQSDKRIEFD